MKGIILAGGNGTRLYPLTKVISKHLLPIYDKPMIYYPFSILLKAGISDILIISKKEDTILYKKLFKKFQTKKLKISFAIQNNPNGLPEAFTIGKDFIKKQDVALILGDNIFYGEQLYKKINEALKSLKTNKSTIFSYRVSDPEKYGVIEIKNNKIFRVVEKPKKFISNLAITGLYFFKNDVVKLSRNLKKSKRGEFEITDLIDYYLKEYRLNNITIDRGCAWLDAGNHDSYLQTSNFVETIEKRQGLKISCLEEIALEKGFINKKELKIHLKAYPDNQYKQYLLRILNEKI